MNYEKAYYYLFTRTLDIIEALKTIQTEAENIILEEDDSDICEHT